MLERLCRTVCDLAALHQPISPLACHYMQAAWPRRSRSTATTAGARRPSSPRPIASRGPIAGARRRARAATGGAAGPAGRRSNARRLAEPGAAAVVTGQQAGLFGGPLFVLYKALATRIVARRVEAARGRPVVPVFWVASDDHDFAEIRSASILDCGLRAAHAPLRARPRARRASPPRGSPSTSP